MEEWEYNELLESVNDVYLDLLNEKRGYKYAIARTFYEFETVCNEGETENLLVHLAIGEIVLAHPKVFVGVVDSIKKALGHTNIEHLENELAPEEIEDLFTRKNNVINGINKVEIDYDPNADNY
ncbi:Imm3 family immunity protein [Bacillus sp. REN3]|uniref:Imm3 family immunity protein n=1 Tax=Bacillus sp. REN3 TaxID=2802440 RepID=UPI001AED4DAB|nr:Imm3 family immunity protein [Bacillus sp. REN3]